MYVYIVVSSELGWDNIVGCFTTEEAAKECCIDMGVDSLFIKKIELETGYTR